jgi:hypothetical protein
MPAINYYAFGQLADRLIQVEVRADGRVRTVVRSKVGGAWISGHASAFEAPTNPANPIKFTLGVDNNSWGLLESGAPEWVDDPYIWDGVQILNLSLPFGADVDWGGGNRKPGAKSFPRVDYTFQNGILTHDDSATRNSWKTSLDISRFYAAPGLSPRCLLVLRVAPNNTGSVVFQNASAALNCNI